MVETSETITIRRKANPRPSATFKIREVGSKPDAQDNAVRDEIAEAIKAKITPELSKAIMRRDELERKMHDAHKSGRREESRFTQENAQELANLCRQIADALLED